MYYAQINDTYTRPRAFAKVGIVYGDEVLGTVFCGAFPMDAILDLFIDHVGMLLTGCIDVD